MNALDVVLVVILASCTLYGLWRGFVHIALGIAGFGIGLALALRLAERGPGWFSGIFASAPLARLAAFAAVLVASLIVTALVIWIGGKLIRAAGISWMDRLAGGIVGLAGGLLSSLGVLLALTTFLPAGSSLLHKSRLAPIAVGGVDLAAAVLPPQMAKAYQERRQALHWAATDSPAVQPAPPAPPPKGRKPAS